MKKFLFLILLSSFQNYALSQIVPVQLSQATLKACSVNEVTARFRGTNTLQNLSLKGELYFGSNSHDSCGASNGVLIEILNLVDESGTSINYSIPVTDTANGTVNINFTTPDSCVLTYRIHIDCSAIPTGANVFPIYIVQSWKDSTVGLNYYLNASVYDTLQSSAILYPKLVYLPTMMDSIGYGETEDMNFTFLNTGFTTANISFRFLEDLTNYCGAFEDVDSLFYKINQGGTPLPYTNGAQAFIQLPIGDTLFIYRSVRAINCLDTCTHQSIFTWQCANRDSLGTAFCSSCYGSDTINYVIQNRIMPQLKVIKAVPVSDQVTNFDVSCPNSLVGMRQWEYFITSEDIGKLDLAVIHFTNYHGDNISSLGLIPENTIQIDTLCSSCNFQMTYGQRTSSLCTNTVNNPIDSLTMVITNFGDGDTIKFRFQSFRCVEEDTLLYNVPKSYTNWTFRGTYSKSRCGLTDNLDYLHPPSGENGIVADVAAVADLSLIYTPTVSDLSSPPNNFGDSADFEIKMNGLFIDQYNSIKQLLGCDPGSANCIPTGYFKVTIECDPGLIVPNAQHYTRIKYKDSLGFINYYEPEYFYQDTSILGQCAAGSYVYYFNLHDSNALQMIKGGFFQFRLRSCCGGQNGAVKYKVLYDWLLNPSGSCNSLTFPADNVNPAICTGTNCEWLPLSFVEDDIVVHCPGCITPGIVVRSYRMERTSYGNKDSNDNGFADSPLTPIEYNSPSFLANRNDYGWYNSGIGDQLTDYLVAEFGAGDSGAGGYNYPMMKFQHSYLNHLQLDRIISAGLDTMKVLPDTVLLYIDTPISGAPDSCIDCGVFNVNGNNFVTQRVLKFFGSSISKILFLDAVNNRYFFSFSSVDSSGHTGVLHGSDIVYNNTSFPYDGFFEGQQYRLSVDYNVTGNFNLPRNYSGAVALDLIRKQSDIENRMWLSGDSLPSFAWNQSVKNPENLNALDAAGWYFPPDTTIGDTAVNQNFANQYIFNCENLDGIHYFYAHIYDVKSEAGYVDDCIFKILTSIQTNLAARIIDPYPFEYHPSNIQPSSYTFTIPTGYHTAGAFLTNEIFSGGITFRNQTVTINVPPDSTFTINDNSFQRETCLEEGDTTTGTKLYYGDIQTYRSIEILVEPDSCNTTGFRIDSTTAVVSFEGDVDHCVDVNNVTTDFVDTLKSLQGTILYNIRPNDQISFASSLNAQSNRICFAFSITNYLDTINSTFAPNYFVVIPDTTTLNWLSNWTYSSSNSTFFPINQQFFLSDTLLYINETHTGDSICASFSYCPATDSVSITFIAGWSCSDSLIQPFDTSALCGFRSFTYILSLDSTNIGLSDGGTRNRPLSVVPYTLCDTLFYECCFKSTQVGHVTLNNIELPNFPSHLGVLDLSIRKGYCDSLSLSSWHSISYDTLQAHWPITATDMDAIGYEDSVLKVTEGISVRIAYMPDCLFEDTLPDVILNANSYCNDLLSSTYDFNNTLNWDSTSKCNDCFTLTKTASDSTIAALDTMSFYIIICPNNDGPSWIGLTEVLPANFVSIDTIPTYVYIDSIECDTVVIDGYFTQAGSCFDNTNFAQINYLNYDSLNHFTIFSDSLMATACVDVSVSCVDPNTIIFLNNDSSHNYLNTYSNASIYVEGLFTVDVDLELINCKVFMAAGSQIIISSSISFNIDDSTQIMGCDSMWQGILMEPGATIQVLNGSKIKDANRAIQLDDECEVYLRDAEFYNNITGVYSAPNLGNVYNLGAFLVTGTTFSFSGSFLPNYIGQPSHGVSPYAGIDLTDVVVSIGELGSDPNHFLNMNFGVKGFRSSMEVANCEFQNIFTCTGYSTKLSSTAIVSVGDLILGLPGNLTVYPLSSNGSTIINCERGVYASFSDLLVTNCKILNVITGVECTQNKLLRKAMVIESIISARKYGIRYFDNAGALSMGAVFNSITINGYTVNGSTIGTAISVVEKSNTAGANFDISFNSPITLIDAYAGIELSSVYKPKVGCNNVLLKIGSGQAISTVGISLLSCVGAQVSQNLVKGYSTTNTSRMGVNTDQSINSLISCNSVDSTGFGFHFTSSNLNTNFRGNIMRNHFEGLHLTNTAVIDTQSLAGNKWIGSYSSGFGAVNLNFTPFSNLLKSLFLVNPANPTLFPLIPANNSGWFQPDSAANYVCSNINPCSSVQIVYDGGDVNLMELIALDSILTSGYVDESRDIAQSILFDFLMTDSALRSSSSTFTTFINSNPVLQSLYEVKLQFHDLRNAEDSAAILLLTLDSGIKVMVDTLRYYNQAIIDNPSLDLSNEINQANISLNIMKAAYSTLVQQFKLRENAILVNAEFYNSQINATGLPLENEETINGVQIKYDLYGKDSIANQFLSFLSIAQQCPSQGGTSVYRARFFVSLFNDSLTYDDFSICLAQGYYREMNPNLNQTNVETNLIIKPNPASEFVEIIVVNGGEKDYLLRIVDLEGRSKFYFNKIANDLKTIINTSELSPGIYFVFLDDFNGFQLSQKLIIVR